jgi:hypothetical protein
MTIKDQLVRELSDGPAEVSDLAERLGKSTDTLRTVLNRHEEVFTKIPDGRWTLLSRYGT